MIPVRPYALAFAVIACLAMPAAAQESPDRAAALADLDRGAAAFRAGDMVGAERDWSRAVDAARRAKAADIAAQALVRSGELYRTQGFLRNALTDLNDALANADASGDARLIAAASGALGSLELAARQTRAPPSICCCKAAPSPGAVATGKFWPPATMTSATSTPKPGGRRKRRRPMPKRCRAPRPRAT